MMQEMTTIMIKQHLMTVKILRKRTTTKEEAGSLLAVVHVKVMLVVMIRTVMKIRRSQMMILVMKIMQKRRTRTKTKIHPLQLNVTVKNISKNLNNKGKNLVRRYRGLGM